MAKGEERRNIHRTFIPDAPLSDPASDLFNRWPFAQQIAQTIIRRTDPSSIVIGIYGSWGEGKTTVLNFIKSELDNSENIVSFRFNPWRFNDENQLLLSFFHTLAEALDRSLSSRKEKIGELIEKYGNIIAPLSLSLGIISVSPGQTIAEAGKKLSSVELDDLKERIENILAEEKKHVVILLDDIDRLDKTEICAVFKLIKQTADFSYTVYVVAFDNLMVTSALSEKYATAEGDAGGNFLEKIIQVPLDLPKADEISLRRLCFKGVDQALLDAETKLTEEQTQEFVNYFIRSLEIRLKTPRMCKRYQNALVFALPILKDEVHPVDLMLIEGIRIFYHHIYNCIKYNPDLFIGTLRQSDNTEKKKDEINRVLNGVHANYTDDEMSNVRDLLQVLFPKFKCVFGNVYYGAEWEETWACEKRIASQDYFARYFTYAVPEGDISDLSINHLLTEISNKSTSDAENLLHNLVNQRNADKVILKLRYKERSLSEEVSIILAKAIARCGSFFPNPEQLFPYTSAWAQAGILVHNLLRNVPQGKSRLEAAEEILKIAEPLTFAEECFRWMRSSAKKSTDERTFSKDEEDILGIIVAKRIQSFAKTEILYIKFGKESRYLLWVWSHWGNSEEIKAYIEKSFELSDKNVIEFLKIFILSSWEMESGLSRPGDFEKDQYDALSKLVNPETIYKKLRTIYGDTLDEESDTLKYSSEPPEKKFAFQFASIFHNVRRIKQQKLDSQQ